MADEPTFTEDEMITAMCLWEAWMDLVNLASAENVEPRARGLAEEAQRLQDHHGVFTIRGALTDLVQSCDDGWLALLELTDDDAPVFGWEWCPRFVKDALGNGLMRQAIEGQYGGQRVTPRVLAGKAS